MLVIKVPHLHKEEIEFLLEQVLGCTCFSNWMNMRLSRLDDGILGFPQAYWENGWQVFWAKDEDAEPFDPYKSLDDAWMLVEGHNALETLFQGMRWWEMEKEDFCKVICKAVIEAYNDEEK